MYTHVYSYMYRFNAMSVAKTCVLMYSCIFICVYIGMCMRVYACLCIHTLTRGLRVSGPKARTQDGSWDEVLGLSVRWVRTPRHEESLPPHKPTLHHNFGLRGSLLEAFSFRSRCLSMSRHSSEQDIMTASNWIPGAMLTSKRKHIKSAPDPHSNPPLAPGCGPEMFWLTEVQTPS